MALKAETREKLVYMEKLSEQAERYDEMVDAMEKVAETANVVELSVEERNLLSVAFKNVVGAYLETLGCSCASLSHDGRSKSVFFLKMKGVYHRYLAEFKTSAERGEAVDNTLKAYKSGQDIAFKELAPTNPIRLGLALNFSVFYNEILNSSGKSCSLARQAFHEAIAELQHAGSVGKTWLKFDVVQVNFSVILDAQSSEQLRLRG
ncbi:hypothetical protein R1flu_023540 [Riccia fluitans]|uniref:14-3-3 domain-containing protein n=1 Tax=Riccia fluitans TaxID=41844 RepID=A0ABD1XWD1_9MARC